MAQCIVSKTLGLGTNCLMLMADVLEMQYFWTKCLKQTFATCCAVLGVLSLYGDSWETGSGTMWMTTRWHRCLSARIQYLASILSFRYFCAKPLMWFFGFNRLALEFWIVMKLILNPYNYDANLFAAVLCAPISVGSYLAGIVHLQVSLCRHLGQHWLR